MTRFIGICIVTPDVDRLGRFYQELLNVAVQRDGDNLAFQTEGALFTIFSRVGMERMAPGCMEGAGYGSYTVEFEVDYVDRETERMTQKGVPVVKPPQSYPWGRRSAWFRDPDGNIVNLFSVIGANPAAEN